MPVPDQIPGAIVRPGLAAWLLPAFAAAVLALILSGANPAPAAPAAATSHLCDRAAIGAAQRLGVPLDVLRAITRTETGRASGGALQPWPWTVNMEGRGVWFASRAEARIYVEAQVAGGARSFDIGCFQLNHRWHGAGFGSIDDMFDPVRNANYAAGFLKRLHGELGDWTAAAGAYHSRTPELARRYTARFERIRFGLNGPDASPAPPVITANAGPGPLIAAGRGALGSLVPLTGVSQTAAFVPLDTRIARLAQTQP